MKKARKDLRNETRIKTVNGVLIAKGLASKVEFDVRVTVDDLGKSMSICHNDIGIMMMIPLEAVSDMVKVVGA